MSRWLTDFKNHPFQTSWIAIKEELEIINVDDQTIPTNVQELARLKKVIGYIDEIQRGLDPELVPKATWTSFQQQLEPCLQQLRSYKTTKNIGNLNQANEHADNLLSYVKPYFTTPEKILEALKLGAGAYESQFTDYAESFRNKSKELISIIESDKTSANDFLKRIASTTKKTEVFSDRLFVEKDGVEPIEAVVNTLVAQINREASEITQLHSDLLIGDKSKKILILEAEKLILASQTKISDHLDAVKGEVEELAKFHKQIFGDKESDNDSGLKGEIERRLKELISLDTENKTRADALFKKIENLLPGATSAGLASAYKELKEKFDKPIKNYTKAFYISLGLLIVAAVVMSVSHISIAPVAELKFIEVQQWDVIFRALIYKTPFIVPIVWLAIFSAKRRSQYERLQQEYAHKEAFAKSYESYKLQLTELNVDSDDLQKALIEKAIQAIAYNASVTLDGKHEESTPIVQLLEKFKPDDLKGLFEWVKKDGK